MPSVVEVNGVQQFRDIVNDEKLTVLCFSAVWCGPCKTIEKDLDKLTYKYPNVRFAKVDADNNVDIVTKCKVMQLPTFMLVKDGQMLGYIIGADIPALKSKVEELL